MWSRLTEGSFISINFKIRCILCDVYSTHIFIIIHVGTFHGSKRDFPVTCVATSFKIRKHYIVANLTVVVHLAQDWNSEKNSTLYRFTLALYWRSLYSALFLIKIIQECHVFIYIYICTTTLTLCHTYPTIMKLGTVKKDPKSIWITWHTPWVLLTSAFFTGNRQILLYRLHFDT